jgi:chromosome transmission fidelity protein 1
MIPGGLICFFPSYDYEAFVYSHFEKQGFIEKLEARKKVFREPKKTGQMDQVCTVFTLISALSFGFQNYGFTFHQFFRFD